MLLQGKVVLVTGGAGGRVGPGISRSLAKHGAAVAINYRTSRERGETLLEQIAAFGGTAELWQCDCKDTEAVKRMVADIVATFGRIDGVVNNATSVGPNKPEWEPENWASYVDGFESEVKMALNTIQATLPYLQAQGGGTIVNITSEQWGRGNDGCSPYVTPLGARVSMSRWLAGVLAGDNVRINMVSPTRTRDFEPMAQGLRASRNPHEVGGKYTIGTAAAEEIGDACAFFISDMAKFISGAHLPVNAGYRQQMGA
jgi:NAD(P)-dependent dehydrogenase (short-subunit alcohol dehydrogenase family)